MSEQAVQSFAAQLEADTEMQQELREVLCSDNSPSIVEFASRCGHEFGEQELRTTLVNASTDELADSELDAVAGGGGIWSMSANDLMALFLKLNSQDPKK